MKLFFAAKIRKHLKPFRPSTANIFIFIIQVFEANIRVLGGLLAAHLLIEDEKNTFGDLEPDW